MVNEMENIRLVGAWPAATWASGRDNDASPRRRRLTPDEYGLVRSVP